MSSAEILDSATGLLSLSVAAANAVPIPVSQNSAAAPTSCSVGSQAGSHTVTNKVHSALKHRRMSSSGQVKRRMSDAREAASRPTAASLSSGTAALNALATLSLAGSPPPQAPPQTSTSFASAVGTIRFNPSEAPDEQVKQEEHDAPGTVANGVSVSGITIKNGNGKKRGTTYQCESCSKVYRHPSCLIKHRWEHTPHWREASKLMLSKHQQVQLLEAAAILSHIAPPGEGGTSLPEDRSLWPSFLSGGLLLPPSGAKPVMSSSPAGQIPQQPYKVSSSAPTQSALSISRPGSAGPRLHDYAIPTASGITHVRPGVVGVSTGNSPAHTPAPRAVPLPVNRTAYRDIARGMSVSSDVPESPILSAMGQQSYGTTGSWSLPRSSVRSRSTSAPKSEEDENASVEVDIEGEEPYTEHSYGFISRGRRGAWKDDEYTKNLQEEKIDEEWDGEMEMEM